MRNRDDLDRFYENNLNFTTRTLYLGSVDSDDEYKEEIGVNHRLAENVIKGLLLLESAGKDPITIIMNNTGGSEFDGMAIYDFIRTCKSHIHIKVFGSAMSMGSIILQAADERSISENSRVMAHYGTPLQASPDMHTKDQYRWTAECKRFSAQMEKIYLARIKEKKPKFTLKQLQAQLEFDWILSAKEAVEYGLADNIIPIQSYEK